MTTNQILLIEDDKSISEMIFNYLKKEGCSVVCAYDGEHALALFEQDHFDLIILDLMLPEIDGLEILRQVREKSTIPILIMSAKDEETDKALGLGFGADDYISKPFSMLELGARVKAAIRRATTYTKRETPTKEVIRFKNLEIHVQHQRVTKRNKEIKLTAKEFEILKLLSTHPGRVFSKGQIYQMVWQEDFLDNQNVINVHMRRLRQKIEDHPSKPEYIETLWGIGYRWKGVKND